MNPEDWEIDEYGILLSSKEKMLVIWIHIFLEIWIQLEESKTTWSNMQEKALENFLLLHPLKKFVLAKKVEKLLNSEAKKGTIELVEYENILSTIDWMNGKVCVPPHNDAKNEYVLLLLETSWKLKDSEHNFEIEVLFTNNKIELVQEMSGLWNRIEWYSHYLKRERIIEPESK